MPSPSHPSSSILSCPTCILRQLDICFWIRYLKKILVVRSLSVDSENYL
jgi:hypothetical protein